MSAVTVRQGVRAWTKAQFEASGIDYYAMTPLQARAILESLSPRGSFVIRYAPSFEGDPKGITHAEVEELSSLGYDIVLCGELTASRALQGTAAGEEDASTWFPLAWAAGMPKGRPILAAVDFDDTLEPSQITPYFRGYAARTLQLHDGQKGARGAYGGLATAQELFGQELIDFCFQTSAWSSEGHPLEWEPRAQVHQAQYLNGFDIDEAVAADYGQWSTRKASPPKPNPLAVLLPAERAAVQHYQQLEKHPHVHPHQVAAALAGLVTMRKQVWRAAVKGVEADGHSSEKGWDVLRRRQRYELLCKVTNFGDYPFTAGSIAMLGMHGK
jgi:hypothetical protein